jgi:arginine repressor
MAKKQKVNKTQAVRDYLKNHPKAMSGEIAAALNKQGVKITPKQVANIKTKINKARTTKKAAKQQAAVEVAAPTAVEKPTKAGDTITLDQVKKVAQTIKAIGGFQRVTEVLEVIRELGGVRKFKDLAEAMSATETDAIPY